MSNITATSAINSINCFVSANYFINQNLILIFVDYIKRYLFSYSTKVFIAVNIEQLFS